MRTITAICLAASLCATGCGYQGGKTGVAQTTAPTVEDERVDGVTTEHGWVLGSAPAPSTTYRGYVDTPGATPLFSEEEGEDDEEFSRAEERRLDECYDECEPGCDAEDFECLDECERTCIEGLSE